MQTNLDMLADQNKNHINFASDPRLIQTDDPATPIHTSFARIYTMNPSNKIWFPSTSASVPVSFYFDKHRSVYRIISYDGSNLVINSTVFPTMTFLKTSSTFGLWSDTKLRTIIGVGFSTNAHRELFSEWFEKVVRAAAAIELCLPLPPPVDTAITVSYGENTSVWQADSSVGQSSGNNLAPQKTVRKMDSSVEQFPGIASKHDGDLLEEYDLESQGGTPEMTHLALKSLQYEREVCKVKQLELDLMSMRSNLTSLHENVQKKTADGEQLKRELSEAVEELDIQRKKVDETEKSLQEENSRVISLQAEFDTLKSTFDEQTASVSILKKINEDFQEENKILKERLRQTQIEFETVEKKWDSVEEISCELTTKIHGLFDVQAKLKDVIPCPTPPE